MKALLIALVLIVLGAAGVRALQETTQYQGRAGSAGRTTFTFHVSQKNNSHPTTLAATSLWDVCVVVRGWQQVVEPEAVGSGNYRAALIPSVASDERRRITGCIDDLSLERIRGHVVSAVDGA